LQNVFRVLTKPEHPLRLEAARLREEISSAWARRAGQGDWFRWPSTAARRGSERLKDIGWRQYGMLRLLGYHVGETQPTPRHERRRILEYVFECHLPPVDDHAYFLEWGKPTTAPRLQKLANTLAAFTRNAKRRDDAAWSVAIDDWEADLQFLYAQYYEGFFGFGWPRTYLLQ
jgi:hypothetical protein